MAAAEGKENAAIARDLGRRLSTVRTWRGRLAAEGIRGPFDKLRSGRPETHGPSARLAVIATVTLVPPDGESAWSQAMIARHLRERGLPVSRATVGRGLADTHVRPHKVGFMALTTDLRGALPDGTQYRMALPPGGTASCCRPARRPGPFTSGCSAAAKARYGGSVTRG